MIELNGHKATIDDLNKELARLKDTGGKVWYFREDPESDPPPEADRVMGAIIEARLPIKFVTKDFD